MDQPQPGARLSGDSDTESLIAAPTPVSRRQSRIERRRQQQLESSLNQQQQQQQSSTPTMTAEQAAVDDQLRRRLAYYLLNPYEKWRASRECPWKLLIQIVKIFIVTTQVRFCNQWSATLLQLIAFASSRSAHITFQEETRTVLRHVLLTNWTDARDVFVYPPGQGPYAIYSRGGFEEALVDVVTKVGACRQMMNCRSTTR